VKKRPYTEEQIIGFLREADVRSCRWWSCDQVPGDRGRCDARSGGDCPCSSHQQPTGRTHSRRGVDGESNSFMRNNHIDEATCHFREHIELAGALLDGDELEIRLCGRNAQTSLASEFEHLTQTERRFDAVGPACLARASRCCSFMAAWARSRCSVPA
jgi:hypothetical protein